MPRRFALAGRITLEHLGPDRAAELAGHPSDTVRGWACYAIGAAPDRTTARRLKAIKPFAADHHFGVREWAWLALRPAIAADLDDAIDRLARWSNSRDQNIRRFASEATRPRGVWCAHLRELRADPARGLPILTPLRADPSKYVQDSVANWINDASKDAPAWARSLASEWLDAEPNAATERICRRALRSLPA
ncbi:MAG: HEAT repeat domain-containing protein [Planctomycetota bacterium]